MAEPMRPHLVAMGESAESTGSLSPPQRSKWIDDSSVDGRSAAGREPPQTDGHPSEQSLDPRPAEKLSVVEQLVRALTLDDEVSAGCVALADQLSACLSATAVLIEILPHSDSGLDGGLVASTSSLACPPSMFEAVTSICQRHPTESSADVVDTPLGWDQQRSQCRLLTLSRDDHTLGRLVVLRPNDPAALSKPDDELIRSTALLLSVHLLNRRQYMQVQQMFDGMIESLISALDAKDAYTCGHSNRVADLAVELATRLGMSETDRKRIYRAGMLHDVGKIGVDDSVLRKPGRLTEQEFEQIKMHPVLGYEILRGIRQFSDILPAVRHHHESFDGGGYPDGLRGDSIPRDAQILAVADAFDAMTSDRPYRDGMSLQRVVEIFTAGRGQQWAVDVVDVLLASPEVMYQYALKKPQTAEPRTSE